MNVPLITNQTPPVITKVMGRFPANPTLNKKPVESLDFIQIATIAKMMARLFVDFLGQKSDQSYLHNRHTNYASTFS